MSARVTRGTMARITCAATAAAAVVSIALYLWAAAHHVDEVLPGSGFTRTFGPGLDNVLNHWSYFTIISNAIIAVTTAMLAVRLDRTSEAFHVWRLVGLVQITITGLVYGIVLAGTEPLSPVENIANIAGHYLSPVLAVVGWVAFGPHGMLSRRRVLLALLVPLAYLAVTLLRGAIITWYPYSFLDVPRLGYGQVLLHATALLVLLLVVASLFAALDRRLARR